MKVTKRSVYAGLAGVGILLGAGGVAAAATSSETSSAPVATVQHADLTTDPSLPGDDIADNPESDEGHNSDDREDVETSPAYTSSVQTEPEVESDDSNDDAAEAAEAAEDVALTALATVTPEEASAAALEAEPGTVDDVELSNESGNVVYEVEVVDAKGAEFDVIIDAGDASVLATQAD